MILTDKEVRAHLRLNSIKTTGSDKNSLFRTITHELDAVDWMETISGLSKWLLSDRDALFVPVQRKNGSWDVFYKGPSELLVNAIRRAPGFIKKCYPYHSFDPRVSAFFDLLSANPLIKAGVDGAMMGLVVGNAVEICFHLNRFVANYRAILLCEDFKEKTRRCLRSALKNERALNGYVDKLFKRCSRMLIVRVDLYYPSDDREVELTGNTVSAKALQRDRERFIRQLKRCKFWNHQLGYCWKLEHGARKGFHYHWLFFFDGARVREDVTIGMLLGEVWESVVGCDKVYWNCNAFKDKYQNPGIGMVSHFDSEKRFGLKKAIAYLTKPDYHLSLSDQLVGRTFGKSIIRARSPSTVGRPRTR